MVEGILPPPERRRNVEEVCLTMRYSNDLRMTFVGPVEATFVPSSRSKSGSTNLPEGVVHIFRDTGNRPAPDELAELTSETLPEGEDAGVTLGVLAVPSWMTPSDFLTFIGPASEGIAHLRIIRFVFVYQNQWLRNSPQRSFNSDFAPNRSIALIRFTNPADAAEFIEVYNGKPFNSMEARLSSTREIEHSCVTNDLARNMSRRSRPLSSSGTR